MSWEKYDQLFERYVQELTGVLQRAESHFEEAVKAEMAAHRSRSEAYSVVKQRMGPPAAHPRVLATIRKFCFACIALNEEMYGSGGDEYAESFIFIHEKLMGKHPKLWTQLSELDYLPIGIDRNGEWV